MITYPTFVKLSVVTIVAMVISTGAMRMQRDDARLELSEYKAQVATATAKAQADARAAEQAMQTQVERLTHAHAKKEVDLVQRAAAASRTAERLLDTIAYLNAGEASTDPDIAPIFEQARTARHLLGTCAERYASVAADADQLAHQVSGLQAFVGAVCKSP